VKKITQKTKQELNSSSTSHSPSDSSFSIERVI